MLALLPKERDVLTSRLATIVPMLGDGGVHDDLDAVADRGPTLHDARDTSAYAVELVELPGGLREHFDPVHHDHQLGVANPLLGRRIGALDRASAAGAQHRQRSNRNDQEAAHADIVDSVTRSIKQEIRILDSAADAFSVEVAFAIDLDHAARVAVKNIPRVAHFH